MDVDANLPEGGASGVLPEGNDAETKARRLGWVPKDEFKGDPDKHRSAEEFLKRGEEILPLMQRDNKRLHDTVDRVEKELKETRETLQSFAEHSRGVEERALKQARAELEAKLDGAVELADVGRARQIRRELEELDGGREAPKPKPEPVGQPDDPKIDAEIQEWIGNNDWFNKSASLRSYMADEFADIEKRYPGAAKSEILAEAKRRTVERFPDKFGVATNPKRDGAAAVAIPTGETPRKKSGRSYDDLPAEAKQACDKFVRTIKGYTKEQYVKDYEWD